MLLKMSLIFLGIASALLTCTLFRLKGEGGRKTEGESAKRSPEEISNIFDRSN